MKKWALLCVLTFCILAILPGGSFTSEKNTLSEPPLPNIIAGEQSIPVIYGSYCWETGSHGKCVDTVSPDMLMKNKPLVAVAKGQKALIDFGDHPPLSPVTELSLWREEPQRIVLKEESMIEFPREEGVYIYSFSGSWPQGSSAFIFQVKVE